MAEHSAGAGQGPKEVASQPPLPAEERAAEPAEGAAETAGEQSQASKDASIGRSTRMMGGLVIITRLTGLLRTWAQAFAIGATMISSCYTLANNLCTQMHGLVAGGLLVTGFMPVYMAVRGRGGQKAGNDYISNLMSIVGVAMLAVTVVGIVFAPQLVWIQSFNATDEFDSELAAWFFRFFSVEFLLYALSVIFSGVNNADREFFWSNIAPAFNNVVVAASFFIYAVLAPTNPTAGLYVLAIGNALAVVVQLAVQIPPALKRGVKIRFNIDLHDPALRDTIALGVPMLAVTLTSFISNSVQTSFALSVTAMGSSIMYYAQVWYAVPYSVLSVPVSTALFTELSESYAAGDIEAYKRDFTRGANTIMFYLIPCTVLLMVFSVPLITIIGGSMSAEEIETIASYMAWLSVTLPVWGLSGFLQKASSAMRNMRFYTMASIVGAVAQIVVCVVFTPTFGLPAVALSATAYYGMLAGVTFVVMRRELGHIGLKGFAHGLVQACIVAVVGGITGIVLLHVYELLVPIGTSALRAFMACAVAALPAMAAAIAAGVVIKNPTAVELAGSVLHAAKKLLRR